MSNLSDSAGTTSPAVLEFQRKTAAAGALLFAIGIATGLWAGMALTGMVKV